jgi:hypothetical protein
MIKEKMRQAHNMIKQKYNELHNPKRDFLKNFNKNQLNEFEEK